MAIDLKTNEKEHKVAKENIKKFSNLIDKLDSVEERKKFLWKQSYENAVSDRDTVEVLVNDLLLEITGNVEMHQSHGPVISKYLERLSKANDQLLRLAELIGQEIDKNTGSSADDVFDAIGR